MKRRLLLIALAAALLVAGINFVTRGSYISGRVERYIVENARRSLGYEAGMGRLVFNFFPSYVDIEKPYVKGWDKDNPGRPIEAERVRVYFSLAALMRREIMVRRVQVYGPSLAVVRRGEEGYNVDPLLRKVRELAYGRGGAGGEVKTRVSEVVAFGGRFSYSDPARGVAVYSGDTGLDIRLRGGDSFWTGCRITGAVIRKKDLPPFHLGLAGKFLWKGGRLTIEDLKAEAEGTKVDASGSVTLAKRPALDLRLRTRLNLGLLDRLSLVRGGPSGEADVNCAVKGVYPELDGSGTLTLRKAEYAGVRVDELSSRLDFRKGLLKVPEIRTGIYGGRVEGGLSVDFKNSAAYSSSWKIRDVVSGYYTEPKKELSFIPWQTVSGTVDISGRGLNASALTAAGSLSLAKYERPHASPGLSRELDIIKAVRLDFRLRDRKIFVEKGFAASRSCEADFTGTVGLDGKSDFAIKGRSSNIGEISRLIGYSDIRGNLYLTAYMQGNITEPEIIGKAQISDAVAHGIPFKAAYGDVGLSGWHLVFKDFTMEQGRSSFLLNGKIMFKGEGTFKKPYYSARLDIKKADARKIIAIFYEDIPVNLVADGVMSFSGDDTRFKGEARLTTGAGDVYGQAVDKAEVTAALDQDGIRFPKVVVVREKDIVTASGGINFDNTFYGKAASARVDLANFNLLAGTGAPIRGNVSLSVTGEGSFDRPVIDASLDSYHVYLKDIDLEAGSAEAHIRGPVMTLGGKVLDRKVALDGSLDLRPPYGWRGKLVFDNGRFEPFIRFLYKDLPEDMTLVSTGTLTGQGNFGGPAAERFDLNFTKLAAGIMGRRLENEGDVVVSYKDRRLNIGSLRLKGESASVEASGGAESLEEVDAALKIKADLSVVKPFVKDSVDYLSGSGDADLKVRGGLKDPAVSGRVRLRDAGIKFKDFQQRFDHIDVEAKLDGGGFKLTSLGAEMGGGTITGGGKGGFKGFTLDNYSFDLTARGVKVKYPEGLLSTVDADVNFEGAGGRNTLSGELAIKKARYTERIDWKTWLVKVQKSPTEPGPHGQGAFGDTSLNLHITGAESIKIDNNVAKMPVSTDMTLRGTVNDPVLVGRFESTGGSVYFRNNEFRLLSAVAEFADPKKINPMVDLQAETKVKEYMIQLTLSGTLDKIKVSVASDPPLEDTDIMTLLTIGRTSEAIKGHESALTTGEATSFVTGQIQDAVESRLRKITGFDRFQIDPYLTTTGTTSGPRLTIGKSLFSDKLYFTYSSNVGTTEDQFMRLEYIFNKNFSAVGERDELGHYGADVKFRFEFK